MPAATDSSSSSSNSFSIMTASVALTSGASAAPSEFRCAKIFDAIRAGLETEGEQIVKRINGIFAFKVTNSAAASGLWIVDCKNGTGSVEFNGKAKPDVTITMSDADLIELMLGKLNPQQAFFTGRLKLQGNMGLGLRLREFQNRVADLQGKL